MKAITLDTRHFYGGEHHDSFGNKTFQSINPATQEVIATIPEANEQDISAAIDAAKIAFKEWNQIDVITRGHLINLIADAIEEHSEELVNIDVQDAGRPILDATEDIEAVVRMYRYFGGLPDKIEGVTIPFGNEKLVFTKREPYGVIAAITLDFLIFQVVKWMFHIFHDFQFSYHIPRPTVDISKFSNFFSFPRRISRPKVCISHFPCQKGLLGKGNVERQRAFSSGEISCLYFDLAIGGFSPDGFYGICIFSDIHAAGHRVVLDCLPGNGMRLDDE